MKFFAAIIASLATFAAALPQQYIQQSQVSPQLSESKMYYTGRTNIDNLNYRPTYDGQIRYTLSTGSVPLSSSLSKTQQQTANWYFVSKQLEDQQAKKYYIGLNPTLSSTARINFVLPERKWYTGLVYYPAAGTTISTPGSDKNTQQQAAYWTKLSSQQKTQ